MNFIREPAVSGMFYPSNPGALLRDIENYMQRASIEPVKGTIIGLISPHAGYMYSGPVAAYGYKAIAGKQYETVIIIAPSHKMYFEGVAIIGEGGYKTPLGTVPIDRDLAHTLLTTNDVIKQNIEVHRGEHALEVQLPFLQVVLKDFRIIPLIMGNQAIHVCEKLSDVLYKALMGVQKKFLIVGSTDLSHYYPYNSAVELDGIVVHHLQNFDVSGLQKDVEREKCEACGAGPMITTMMVSKKCGATKSKVLKYANSGDVSGDKSGVVGYVSCVFYNTSLEEHGET